MTKEQVLRETYGKLYALKLSITSDNKTNEEDYLESIIRLLIGCNEDKEIPISLDILRSYNIWIALSNVLR